MKTYLSALLLLALTGCDSVMLPGVDTPGDASPGVEVRYGETQCADPWSHRLSGPTTADQFNEIVAEYLRENGLRNAVVLGTEVYSYGPFCMACHCPSGRVIRAKVREKDVENAAKLGFRP